ncbi:MAG: class I SAM-dependent methyltransferase, partial [Deltaproteobacteria bacterium]|nr:class I SAM-dependent methyltransferase [Deltaproteobacteria bacterium]
PLMVKGITRKIVETRTEHEDGKERIIETDKIVISINAINEKGELITIT